MTLMVRIKWSSDNFVCQKFVYLTFSDAVNNQNLDGCKQGESNLKADADLIPVLEDIKMKLKLWKKSNSPCFP